MHEQAPRPKAPLTGDKPQISAELQDTAEEPDVHCSDLHTAQSPLQTVEPALEAPKTSGGRWSLMLGKLWLVWDDGISSSAAEEISRRPCFSSTPSKSTCYGILMGENVVDQSCGTEFFRPLTGWSEEKEEEVLKRFSESGQVGI